MPKKSKRERALQAQKHEETRYFRTQPWRDAWVQVITADSLGSSSRLRDLLFESKPVNDVPCRPPSMDAEKMLRELVEYFQIPVTADAVSRMDTFINACYRVGTTEKFDVESWIGQWSYPNFYLRVASGDQHIVNSLYIARMFESEVSYDSDAWTTLLQGLGLREGGNDSPETMLIAACAQLLGAGHRMKKWCAGRPVGLEGRPEYFDDWYDNPAGKQDFNEILLALEAQKKNTESEWAKAVVEATQEHFDCRFWDLSSKDVYDIIFVQTRPGATSGDEAPADRPCAGDMAPEDRDE